MGIDNKPWWCPMIQDYAKYFKCFVINSQDSSIKEILKSSLNRKLGSKRRGNLPQIIEVASCRANIHSFPKVCALWRLPTSSSAQFSSVAQSCLTLCDPMNRSTPGLPVHHQLLEFTETHVHRVSDAIQPSHPLSSPSPPAPNPSQHQSLFQWVRMNRYI